MIATAFKSQIGEIRLALKNIKVLKNRQNVDSKQELLNMYKEGLKNDLIEKADRCIRIIEDYCLNVAALKGYIFFLKMQGDFYRYKADAISSGDEKTEALEAADEKYSKARAFDKLRIDYIINKNAEEDENDKEQRYLIDDIRLGLCLNYAVFLYEVKNQKKEALRLLKGEIHDALDDYDKWDPEQMD